MRKRAEVTKWLKPLHGEAFDGEVLIKFDEKIINDQTLVQNNISIKLKQ